jgi:hypothetical protein
MTTLEQRIDDLEYRLRTLEIGQESTDLRTEIEQVIQEQQPEPELVEPPEGLLSEEIRKDIFMRSVPEWSANETYVEGALVKHDNKVWRAMPDVANFEPDDTYDIDANTGGWAPFNY